MTQHDRLHNYININKAQMVEDLKALLRIPSVEGEQAENAPFGTEVERALNLTLDICRKLGLKAVNVDGYAGYAEIEGCEGEQIGVLTHLDVVPAGKGWTHPPFDAYQKDGIIWARGICDDKAPAIASIYALAALKSCGITPKRNIRLIFGCNEESGWKCIEHYDKTVGLPEIGFSPDADYPIINTEKGIYHGELSINAEFDGYEVEIYGGERANVVPAEASAVIKGNTDRLMRTLLEYDHASHGITITVKDGVLTINATGKAAHASTPQNGKNAFFALLDLLDKLDLGSDAGKAISLINRCLCGSTDGSGVGLAIKDDISGALTLNLGILNYKNGVLSFTVDVRYPITISDETVSSRLKQAFPLFKLCNAHVQQPHHIPEDHFLVRALSSVYEQNTGQKAHCIAIGGGTYARALKCGVAFGVTRPGAPELAHNADERMSIDDFISDTHMFADAYLKLTTEV